MRRRSHRFCHGTWLGNGLLALTLVFAGEALAVEEPVVDLTREVVDLTREEKEAFLLHAEILDMKSISVGVTRSLRATLSDGERIHDAHVQTVDISKSKFSAGAASEVDFRDFYGFNIAAYRLDKLLDLNMVPVSVKRRVEGKNASVTWWVDAALMSATEFWKRGGRAPVGAAITEQMAQGRVFQKLVYNKDPNTGNFVIDEDWKAWMLDFTRSFRRWKKLEQPEQLQEIGRGFYQRLRDLDETEVKREVGPYLRKIELKALLARRELLVRHFETEIAKRGDEDVLIDRPGF